MSERRAAAPSLALTFVALVSAAEGLTLLVFGVLNVVNLEHVTPAITNAVFFGLFGVGLCLATWGLLTLRTWSRSPIVLAQIFAVGVCWVFRDLLGTPLTLVLGFPAVLALLIMVSPSTTELLYGTTDGEGENGASASKAD